LPEIDVVHLVWKPAGLGPFQEFLRSYREHPAGKDHELVILFNGFRGDDLAQHQSLLGDISHRELRVPSPVRDLAAYFWGAGQSEARYICFLNSYSTLRAGDWLRTLYGHVSRPGIAAAGCTGSWESLYTNYLQRTKEAGQPKTPVDWAKHVYLRLNLHRSEPNFRPAPNPHLRSNAFILERSRWLSLRPSSLRTKWATWLFESGRRGMTAQLTAHREEVLVVGRDGRGYRMREWDQSNTFRKGDQANLLVSDNRTREYAEASDEMRRCLSRLAWGE
jgi:hypothetical protein